jgi:preprotein translocase subunit SecA
MLQLINKGLASLFGKKSDRDLKEIQPIVEKIHEEYKKITSVSNDELRAHTATLRQRIADYVAAEENEIESLKSKADDHKDMDLQEREDIYNRIDILRKEVVKKTEEVLLEILPEAFAILKETARRFKENSEIVVTANEFDKWLGSNRKHVRIEGDKAYFANSWEAAGNMVTWDMVHYDVQLIGGIILHKGKIAEMATGEGKTLVATLPIFLNALPGKGIHIVTVNNYLAKRDGEWMGPIMEFHGLKVDCIDKHEPNTDQRRNAYLADITYGTNNEFGFDYLRDNMVRDPEEMVQRPHNYAIVDEVDSVLIDDARTPLIISGPTPKGEIHEFFELKPEIEKLVAVQRNYVNTVLAEAKRLFSSTDKKEKEDAEIALLRAYRGLPKNKALIKFLSEPGVKTALQKVEAVYSADHNKEMPKIDQELYFVIDERHSTIELTEKGIELISTGDSRFYVLPDVGAEIAEIEKRNISNHEKFELKEKLMEDYAVKSERVHTMNQLLRAYTLFEIDVEYVVMDNKVKIVDEQTGRILDGRRYSDGLHQAIEAKENVKVEAATQTYATVTLQNYFRMYNKLAGMTGTAETESAEFWDIYKLDVVVIPTNRAISRTDKEDLVYKTKREKYNAVIDVIVEETTKGRPVLVGTTSVEISELLSRMLKLKNIKHNVLNAKLHQKEAEIVAFAGQPGTVTIATNMAGRGTDIKLGAGVKEAGGLAIIGTERHDSRRVDRQLRGRAGRQGDPGSSQFFVSLEDDLMRLFGSDRISALMDRMGLQEGEVIQHSMITKSIERAQTKVEENHFGTRKRLLEYDDVMNKQRDVIYKRRRNALYGERLAVDISNSMYDVSNSIVQVAHDDKNYEGLELELIKVFGIETPFSNEEFFRLKSDQAVEKIFDAAMNHYHAKRSLLAEQAYPAVKNIYENPNNRYENIVFPITDGIDTMQVIVNLKKCFENKALELFYTFEKMIPLNIIDEAWKEHLREMDELKQSVQNAVYEQKDPLLVYKSESFNLFTDMMHRVNKDIISFLSKAHIEVQEEQVKTQAPPIQAPAPKLQTFSSDNVSTTSGQTPVYNNPGEQEAPKQQPIRVEKTVGRNDPCPCGSGKKFKNCHGIDA